MKTKNIYRRSFCAGRVSEFLKGTSGIQQYWSQTRIFLSLCLHQQLKFDYYLYIVHAKRLLLIIEFPAGRHLKLWRMCVVVPVSTLDKTQSSSCFKTSCSRLSILALLWSVTKSALHNIFAQGYQQRPEALTILLFNWLKGSKVVAENRTSHWRISILIKTYLLANLQILYCESSVFSLSRELIQLQTKLRVSTLGPHLTRNINHEPMCDLRPITKPLQLLIYETKTEGSVSSYNSFLCNWIIKILVTKSK